MDELFEQYSAALRRHVASGGESGLGEAYDIARQAIDRGVGLLDLVGVHTRAAARLDAGAGAGDRERREAARHADAFLLEVVAPFELTHRGYRAVNVALVSANRELRRTNEDLERVSNVISHDLQQPLMAAASQAYALSRRMELGGDPAGAALAAKVNLSIQRAQEMLQGLLAVARAGGAAEPVERVDLTEMAQELADELAQARGVPRRAVAVGNLPTVTAPRLMIRQVLQNLLDNAVKYSGDHPEVEVDASRGPDAWIVSVSDNGIGVPPAAADRIFEIFQRATDTVPGSGVGLAVSKREVERMGGRIWVEPHAGRGSTFRFTIPVGPGR